MSGLEHDTEAGWYCLRCEATFATPSFSEGPKVWDENLQTEVRFRKSLNLCPECLSPRIGKIMKICRLNS